MILKSYTKSPLAELKGKTHSFAGAVEATVQEITDAYKHSEIREIEGATSRYHTIRITHHNGNYDLVEGTVEEIKTLCLALTPAIKGQTHAQSHGIQD